MTLSNDPCDISSWKQLGHNILRHLSHAYIVLRGASERVLFFLSKHTLHVLIADIHDNPDLSVCVVPLIRTQPLEITLKDDLRPGSFGKNGGGGGARGGDCRGRGRLSC